MCECCCSVTQPCLILCNPGDCNRPGLCECMYPIMNSISSPGQLKLNTSNVKVYAFLFQTCSNQNIFDSSSSLVQCLDSILDCCFYLTSTFCFSHAHISNPFISAFGLLSISTFRTNYISPSPSQCSCSKSSL